MGVSLFLIILFKAKGTIMGAEAVGLLEMLMTEQPLWHHGKDAGSWLEARVGSEQAHVDEDRGGIWKFVEQKQEDAFKVVAAKPAVWD